MVHMVECIGVQKKYNENLVVKAIDMKVKKGEIFGLLGPNGAGKSTTIAMLSSQLQPTSGTVSINGLNIRQNADQVKSIVGIVPQDIALYSALNAYDNLRFFGEMYGLKGKALQEKMDRLLERIGLKDKAKAPIKTYSGGMKRRINIAAALLHDPLVVFMDEPTVGIDPQSRNNIYKLIENLKAEGKTIIYTTHYMEEATALCDRVAVMDNGRIIALDTVGNLIGSLHGGIIELSFHEECDAATVSNIQALEGVVTCRSRGAKLEVIVKDVRLAIQPIISEAGSRSVQVEGINILPPTLETLFLYLTGNELRD